MNRIVEENKLTTTSEYFQAYRVISRYEYWPGVAPGMFVPILLGISSLWDILNPYIFETIIICILLYFSGFVINSIVDHDLDLKYGTFKSEIPKAVDLIGMKNVKTILALQVIGALTLSLHMSIALNNYWLIVLASLGVLFGIGYSAKPFYFKVKGIWHAISLGSSAFFIPLMFIYMVVADPILPLGVLLIIGVTIAHYSLAMANQAADHLEDEREGVLTPPVRLGLTRTLKWSMIVTTLGAGSIMVIVGAIYLGSDSTGVFTDGLAGLPFSPMVPLLAVMAIVLAIAYYIPIKGLRDLYKLSSEPVTAEERMERIKKRINYAPWQASGIAGIALTLTILFVGGLLSPVTESDDDLDPTQSTALDINSLRISNVVVTTADEGTGANYADVTVRLSMQNIDDTEQLPDVTAFVDAGTADQVFDTSSSSVDETGRAILRVELHGTNESEVWYFVYLIYNDERSSYTWSEPSESDLYIFDARLRVVEEGLLQDRMQLTVNTFNAGPARVEDTITIKIEWAPLVIDLVTNNATVNPQQVWETSADEWLLKDLMTDSSSLKIYLYYDDEQMDEMMIEF